MMKYWKLLIYAGAAMVAQAAEVEWMHDVEKAAAKAAQQGKMMLVEFTGSDWCKACVLQKKNVLVKPAFADWVQKNYIPVEMDVPMNAALVGGEAQLNKNKKFCDDFGIRIFPSLMIMTPELVLLGGLQGSSDSPQSAIAALGQYKTLVESYQSAMALNGEARALALFDVYQQLPQEYQKVNYALMQLIVDSDIMNRTGLRDIYMPIQQMKELEKKLNAALTFESKLAILDASLAQALPVNKSSMLKQKEMLLKGEVLRLLKKPGSVEDVLKARDLSIQAVECTENEKTHAKQKQRILEYFADPEALFKTRSAS